MKRLQENMIYITCLMWSEYTLRAAPRMRAGAMAPLFRFTYAAGPGDLAAKALWER